MRLRPILTRLLASWGLALAVSAVPVARVAACDCMMMAPGEALAMSDVAFTGTVSSETPTRVPPGAEVPFGPEGAVYAFAVDGVAKGAVGAEVQVLAGGADGASCGMSFGSGERWLIFATGQGDSLSTHLCMGNAPLAAGEEPPVSVAAPEGSGSERPEPPRFPLQVLLPVGAVALVAAASAFLFLRAERPR